MSKRKRTRPEQPTGGTVVLTLDQWKRRGGFTDKELKVALRIALKHVPGMDRVFLGRRDGKACYLHVEQPITSKAEGGFHA